MKADIAWFINSKEKSHKWHFEPYVGNSALNDSASLLDHPHVINARAFGGNAKVKPRGTHRNIVYMLDGAAEIDPTAAPPATPYI